ncbi:MAG: hypothetical protein KatS3mg077_1196 [Candidatus Binatia bacterium]|nr:MAG: hypothetical protein KatS3mg077_1196 [Candidatus Binatia bacterium]
MSWLYLADAEVWAAPLAFVTNFADGTVSVIDTAADAVVATLAVGSGPAGVAVEPAGTRAYVVNSGSQSISVIDTSTLSVSTPLQGTAVGNGAFGVAVSPDGSQFHVTNRVADTVFAYDAAGPSFLQGIGYFASVPLGIAVDAEGVVYATLHSGPGGSGTNGPGYVKIDPPDFGWNLIARGTSPNGIAVTGGATGGHRQVYFADEGANAVVTYDTTRYPYPYTHSIAVGSQPYGVAVSPDSSRLYVTNTGSNTLSIIDVASDAVVATVAVGAQPRGVAAHPDGRRVYVANSGSGTVSVVDVSAASVVATIAVGSSPWSLGQFIKPFCTTDADCYDGLSCTTDTCDAQNGVCQHTSTCATPTPTPMPARNVSLNPAAATIGVGDTVTLNLHIDDTSEIVQYYFGVAYDATVLAYQSMVLNTPSWCMAQANAAYAGKICIAIQCSNHLYPANNPDLATIQFQGIAPGVASVTFAGLYCGTTGVPACDLQADGGGLFTCNRTGASIQVTGGAPTPTNTESPTATHTATVPPQSTPTETPAGAADSDGDGVPDSADNCPAAPNPTQQDLDSDGAGDVCDPNDAALVVDRVTIRPHSQRRPDDGRVTARGYYMAPAPQDGLDAGAGLGVVASDGSGLTEAYQWSAAECSSIRGGGLRCISSDGLRRLVIRASTRNPGTFRWTLRCTHRSFGGPLGGPAALALTHLSSAIDRVGSAANCSVWHSTLRCRP